MLGIGLGMQAIESFLGNSKEADDCKSKILVNLKQQEMKDVNFHSVTLSSFSKTLNGWPKKSDRIVAQIKYPKDGTQILVQLYPKQENENQLFDWLIDTCYLKYLFLVTKKQRIPLFYHPDILVYKSMYPCCTHDSNIASCLKYSWLKLREWF